MELQKIIAQIDAVSIPKDATITQLKHEEDNAPYQVWKIDAGDVAYILKEAKGNEKEFYSSCLATAQGSVPAVYQMIPMEEKTYLLMECIEGEDLCRCNRTKLTLALDALISLQQKNWETGALDDYDQSLAHRQNRGRYLNDALLEAAYEKFLRVYQSLPKTLCHDDLLPFNIISCKERAVLIDWECGGMLPYPTSFARFIAHTEEDPNALFYMTEADKQFAIGYYYDHLLKEKGISEQDWRKTLEYFLFYEYCEWVFVGNRYQATDGEYYQKYLPIAKQQAAKIMKTESK